MTMHSGGMPDTRVTGPYHACWLAINHLLKHDRKGVRKAHQVLRGFTPPKSSEACFARSCNSCLSGLR